LPENPLPVQLRTRTGPDHLPGREEFNPLSLFRGDPLEIPARYVKMPGPHPLQPAGTMGFLTLFPLTVIRRNTGILSLLSLISPREVQMST
jgi:hypothetical protein